MLPGKMDAKAEGNFYYARGQNDKVCKAWTELQPSRHLGNIWGVKEI